MDQKEKSNLTNVNEVVNLGSLKPQLPSLLDRLNAATLERGRKSELAKFLGVSLVQVSQWLNRDREPGGETTLRLLKWVEQEERQK
jgi:transcriptional regulator with XRE-family HTH domain